MDRAFLEASLTQAERHVAHGIETLSRQGAIVEVLEQQSLDTSAARELMRQFEQSQDMHVADRDRLRKEVGLVV
jgi:hypothetical protein